MRSLPPAAFAMSLITLGDAELGLATQRALFETQDAGVDADRALELALLAGDLGRRDQRGIHEFAVRELARSR